MKELKKIIFPINTEDWEEVKKTYKYGNLSFSQAVRGLMRDAVNGAFEIVPYDKQKCNSGGKCVWVDKRLYADVCEMIEEITGLRASSALVVGTLLNSYLKNKQNGN